MGCRKKECEEVINEPYVYPVEAAKGKTFEEHIAMYKIPEQTLHCLSTSALLESCLDYPEMRMIWTRSELQNGFDDVRKMCNGFDELFGRNDRFQKIYSFYQQKNFTRDWNSFSDLENGRYMDDIVRVELIISQYEILNGLSVTDKIELLQLALDNQKKKSELIQYWGIVGMQTTCAILSRIMYLDNYQPLVEEYNNNDYMLILIAYVLILDSDVIDKVMGLSEDYLKILKNQQK